MPKTPKLPPRPEISFKHVLEAQPDIFVALFRDSDGTERVETNSLDFVQMFGFLELVRVLLVKKIMEEYE